MRDLAAGEDRCADVAHFEALSRLWREEQGPVADRLYDDYLLQLEREGLM